MGPLTEATLFCDFLPIVLDPYGIDWAGEASTIVDQRLAALTQRLIRQMGLTPPARIVQQLQDAAFTWTERTCLASKKASDDLCVLRAADVDFVVTKGPGIAQYAPRQSERPYADIDIFVPTESFGRTLEILQGLGYAEEERNRLPWQRLNRVCREAVNLRSTAGGSIDVHHRIPPWFWGVDIEFAQVRRRAVDVVISGGGRLPCADPVDNLLVSALHIVSDKNHPGSNLMAWRDFLLLAHRCDPNEVRERARATRLCGWLQWIIHALPPPARPLDLVAALVGEDPRIRGQRRLAMVIPPGVGSRHVVGQVFRLPAANAVMYLAGMAWPSPSFLRSKVGDQRNGRSAWWRGGILGLADQHRAGVGASSD
jgi:hypothetical protein